MKLSGWGRYPEISSQSVKASKVRDIQSAVRQALTDNNDLFIARGLGRSYGDSSLSTNTLLTEQLDQFLNFDESTGIVHCASGVSLTDILNVFIPRGWFLPVTPGTQFVTVGGAIASDVHGKNHHLDGSFSDHIINLRICVATGDIVKCSPTENRELFLATCGGMGLTGTIVSARFKLIPIESAFIEETTWKTDNLAETIALFEEHQNATYSVAWIDCLTKGKNLGRSLLMLGEHAKQQDDTDNFKLAKPSKLTIPLDMPSNLLNSFTVKSFNTLYYNRVREKETQRLAHYAPFFYPLDSIKNWNRLYGKNGFTQYQFVLPQAAGYEGMAKVLNKIVDSKRGSFLAVLKAFGKGNENYLSFPMKGYTLAIDFKIDQTLFAFLDELDQIVLDYGGRLYLAKDARMTEATFKQSYPQWEQFQAVRQQYGSDKVFNSLQSKRLGL
ncbi:MAG: decaprenylphospho-beta-D-ribofuranose 2-oxidase [Thiomicrorhabdus sp.]|nr:MAG: decaprenylphospho-beta-D-ribofuranose 2-oxidase [Thiomicrorhabdus sp.]